MDTAGELAYRTIVRVSITAAIVVLLLAMWYTAKILLLVFGGILLAVLFNGIARALSRITHWSYRVPLSVVMLGILVLGAGAVWLRAATMLDEIHQMEDSLPKAFERVRQSVAQLPFGEQIMRQFGGGSGLLTNTGASPQKIFTTTASTIGYAILLLFVTIYLAAQPGYYRKGMLLLIPPSRRGRAKHIASLIAEKLWWWLIARLAAMAVVGILVATGLSLLGVPLAMTLGVLAAVLDFVPNFGPIVAAIPAILLGLLQSPQHAFYVVLLYWGIQIVEGYIVTPWLQQKAIDMPPALIITAQLILGALLGTLGLVFATPLTAIAILLTNELYVEPDSAA